MDRVRGNSAQPPTLIVPYRTLLVLCGPAGCGKSTFAQQIVTRNKPGDFQNTMIVSSDTCRALISDNEANQQVNRDTFDLFYYIIGKRMYQNRFTIADSTALQPDARQRLLDLAERHHYYKHLFIFDVSFETCMQRDQQRKRRVGEQVITYHSSLLKQALLDTPGEKWDGRSLLNEQSMNAGIEVTLK
ncbi:MAG: AAA family ATPase [Ktedonobacteraceae bacterium]|nr:AAA family ATPase [Ktedonobacteraceae bacterium]